jgi:NADH dehydrogenase
MTPRRVVIVGGGFAAVACAKALRAACPPGECEVVVFNPENHMVFHPLLAEVAGASLHPDVVAAPLRQMLPGVRCRTERVNDVDLVARTVSYTGHDGHEWSMAYDHVVIACGRPVNMAMIPGMVDHALPLKTAGDAVALRSHVMEQLEKADVCDDDEQRRRHLRFVVVGGGFSGVEIAGEVNDLLRSSRGLFPQLSPDEMRVTIVHAQEEILPEVSTALRSYAHRRMARAGIEIMVGANAAGATAEGVWLADGRLVSGATIVCTIGTSTPPVVERMAAPKIRGALETEPDMRIRGHVDAWGIGDCAVIMNAFDGRRSPPTAQFAERQGRQAGVNIARALRGAPTSPFHHRPLGAVCAIGGHSAVAELLGVRMGGFLTWCLWRSIYLLKLPTWSKRVRAGLDWMWQMMFGRDFIYLRATPSERVTHAHLRAGDYVFRSGEAATSLYVIERGEVEIVDPRAPHASVAVLGRGDFFGEMALVAQRPHAMNARARTDAEVVVVGARVFEQMSSSLAPLRDLLADTIARRHRELMKAA